MWPPLNELITRDRLTTAADVFAGASVSPSAGYNALAVLTTAGLITHTHGHLQPGTATLDDIAHAHGLHQQRMRRVARHHQHRAAWKHRLAHHYRPTPLPLAIPTAPTRPQSARAASAHHRTAGSERQPNPRRGTPLVSGPPRSGSAGVGECPPLAPTTARATSPRAVVEIYVEASDTPIAGGRWLIARDSTVIYERPTGVRVASTVPASLPRHSPSWTCLFRRGVIGDSAKQCQP